MKKHLVLAVICLVTIEIAEAQITNTFPLNDSVGIGTTTPTELLQVNGNIKIATTFIAGFPVGGGTMFGFSTLANNITGTNNTAFGQSVLAENLSGSSNCGFGTQALSLNKTGNQNVAIGNDALIENTAGSYNTALGNIAARSNLTGNYNVAIGFDAAHYNRKGSYNVAAGVYTLYNNVKGNNNVALGYYALELNTNGNNNTAVGNEADVTSGTLTNATALGNGAMVDASNKVRIGNASVSSNGGQVEWTAYSDARVKTKIEENVPGLEFINLLKPVTYHFDVDKQNELMGVATKEKVEGMYDIEKIQWTGFLAQDVEAAAKKINYDFSGIDKSGELMGLRYSSFVVPMVKAIQELDEKVMQLEQVQEENEALEERITQLEKLITKQGIVLNDAATDEIYKQSATIENESGVATLSQNVPNPFAGTTSIAYYVPETAQQAHIKIANANGVSLFMAEVRLGNGVLEVDATQLAAGTYSYTLLVDGKVIDTKLMVFIK